MKAPQLAAEAGLNLNSSSYATNMDFILFPFTKAFETIYVEDIYISSLLKKSTQRNAPKLQVKPRVIF